MKFLNTYMIILLLPAGLSSCTKEKANKGPYYDQYIGTWTSIGSSEKEEIEVKPNGIIIQTFELERRKKLVVTKWNGPDTSYIAGNSWVKVGFRGKYETGITLYIDFTADTIMSPQSGPYVVNGVLTTELKYKRFVKVN